MDSSDAVLASFAKEQASIRSSIKELPATLKGAKGALTSANNLALQSGPAFKKLIPGAKATAPALRALRPFFQQTAGPIQNQIRPFTSRWRARSPTWRRSRRVSEGPPGLRVGFTDLNSGLNALAYNPPGDQEGFPSTSRG